MAKNKCLASTPGKERVTKTRYTLPPETTKKPDKIYETYFSDIGYQVMQGKDPWERGNEQDESYNFPVHCHERVSRLQYRKEEPWRGPEVFLSKDISSSLRRPRPLEFARQNIGKQKQKKCVCTYTYTHNNMRIHIHTELRNRACTPPVFIWDLSSVCVCVRVRKTPKAGKSTTLKIRRNTPQRSQRLGRVCYCIN